MTAPLLIVTGTGTGIGKTVVATALVSAWSRHGVAVAGLKPIESGVLDRAEDVEALGQVSTFHVTRFTSPYLLADPVSPHLAARRAGRVIDLDVVARWLAPIRAEAEAIVLELPGGLFTPLTDRHTNADLLIALAPAKVLLVAPDRLGVLHDLITTTSTARARGVVLDGIILSAPAIADASTGTNADEVRRLVPDVPVLATLPRAARDVLVEQLGSVVAHLAL